MMDSGLKGNNTAKENTFCPLDNIEFLQLNC